MKRRMGWTRLLILIAGFILTTGIVHAGSVTVRVENVWDDHRNAAGKRVPVEIALVGRAGDEIWVEEVQTASAGTDQTLTWSGLAASVAGKPATYYVRPVSVDYYTTEIAGSSGEGYVITQHYTGERHVQAGEAPETRSIEVEIRWLSGKKSPVEVHLLADDQKTGRTITLSGANGWKGTFDEVPLEEDGKSIEYTVMEDVPEGAVGTISGSSERGFTIRNQEISSLL